MNRNKEQEKRKKSRLENKKEQRAQEISMRNPGLPCTNVKKTDRLRTTKEFYKDQTKYINNVAEKTEKNRQKVIDEEVKEVMEKPKINKVLIT